MFIQSVGLLRHDLSIVFIFQTPKQQTSFHLGVLPLSSQCLEVLRLLGCLFVLALLLLIFCKWDLLLAQSFLPISYLSVQNFLSQFQGGIAKCHDVYTRKLFLTVLEARKSKLPAPTDWVSGKGLLCASQVATFCPILGGKTGVPSHSRGRSGERIRPLPPTLFPSSPCRWNTQNSVTSDRSYLLKICQVLDFSIGILEGHRHRNKIFV